MKRFLYLFIIIATGACSLHTRAAKPDELKFYPANNSYFQYTGRIDFTDPLKPRFWAPGVYIRARFKGTGCQIVVNDEVKYTSYHNYIEIKIDNAPSYRVQTSDKSDIIKVGSLKNGTHTITICKDTESGIGYLEFVGLKCEKLLAPPEKPKRKLEFIGTSITAGADLDRSVFPCNFGEWYSQHNAYQSFGPLTARNLNAQWQVTAVSGTGLVRSCCNDMPLMPKIYNKMNQRADSVDWSFATYQPDVVTVCLGENDGIQDSVKFCEGYVNFIGTLHDSYPRADIICLNIPTGDLKVSAMLIRYTDGVVKFLNAKGDAKVHGYNITKAYTSGCNGHPDMDEHSLIADELTLFIKQLKKW